MKRKTNAKDWAGQRFYKLTFIKPTDKKLGKAIMWEAICDCGNLTTVVPYDVRSGNTTSCGCYRKEVLKQISKINGLRTRKYSPIISSARTVWSNYNECSFELFMELSQQNCYYCNRPPYRVYNVSTKASSSYTSENQLLNGNFTYNGLDRIDSTKGHVEGNLVPCCWDCNKAKSALTTTEFLTLIKMIYDHHHKMS